MKMLEQHYREITQSLEDRTQLQALDITNVARWWFDRHEKSVWNITEDIPCAAPPFQVMWMEYAVRRVDIGSGWIDFGGPFDVGTSVYVGSNSEKFSSWVASFWVYTSVRKKLSRIDSVQLVIDKATGAIRDVRYGSSQGQWSFTETLFLPFVWAIALMHAKNVEMIDNPLTPAVAKRRQRDGKPAITFKVLDIRSMRRQAVNAKEGGDTSAKRAMHIVRGHFKDYRESGGLFGKHQGLYWWDMHVSGKDSDRKVIKDYRVDAPAGED